MEDDLKDFLFDSLEDPNKQKKAALNLIAEALSRPEVVEKHAHDPLYEQVKEQQKIQPESLNIPTRSADSIAHPERAAIASRQKKIEQRAKYAENIANLPNKEIENLCALMKNEGRFVIDSKAIKKMAEESGHGIETEKMEELGLVKREIIQDSDGWLIEFVVTKEGKNIYSILKQYFERKIGR